MTPIDGLPQLSAEESQAAGARFTVGEKLYLVTFHYKSTSVGERTLYSHSAYYGTEHGSDLGLMSMELTLVEIKGHYLVPYEHDAPDKKPRFNGFIAEDELKRDYWLNQYPKHTGRSDKNTEADYYFTNISTGMPGVRRRAVELCHVLRSLDESANSGEQQVYTNAMQNVLNQRHAELINTFHSTFPTKRLMQSGLIVNGKRLAGYHVTDREPPSMPIASSMSAKEERPSA